MEGRDLRRSRGKVEGGLRKKTKCFIDHKWANLFNVAFSVRWGNWRAHRRSRLRSWNVEDRARKKKGRRNYHYLTYYNHHPSHLQQLKRQHHGHFLPRPPRAALCARPSFPRPPSNAHPRRKDQAQKGPAPEEAGLLLFQQGKALLLAD